MYSKCSRTRRFFRIEDFLRIEDLFPIEDRVSQGTNLSEGKSQNTCFIDLFALAQMCLGHNEKKVLPLLRTGALATEYIFATCKTVTVTNPSHKGIPPHHFLIY